MCDLPLSFECVPELDGGAGTPLFCNDDGILEATNVFDDVCMVLCPMDTNGTAVDACAGFGHPANCVCEPNVPEACDGAELGCFNGDHIKLCHNGQVVIGQCNNCAIMNGYYTCTE
jgi:hypothetical protein